MSDSQQKPWSDNPNAPQIAHDLYLTEKHNFAGALVSSILYGTVVVLFFQCVAALFNPVHRRGESIKWGLVSFTVAMFSAVSIQTAADLNIESISYIENREFPGAGGAAPPGPLGYQFNLEALTIVSNLMSNMNNWLADGLLLYRCYVVYAANFWVIAFPCLMYLGSLVMGIVFVYQSSYLTSYPWSALPYFSISLSLNTLLTLMIVARLVLHTRNTRIAMGGTGIGGLCKAIVTMLVESCALYAVNSLLVIGPLSARNNASSIFLPILAQTQVIAPLLIILRVANKSALTRDTAASGRISSLKARSQGVLTGGDGALPGGDPTRSVSDDGTNSGGLGVGVEAGTYTNRDMD